MSSTNEINPPRWPLKVLRYFVRRDYLEEIEGDMEEVFRDNLTRGSLRRARWRYAVETTKLLRPILIHKLSGIQIHPQQAMFLNYFKISFRGLMKNPLNSFINVFGMAAAIGVCLFAYAFARWTYSTDQFHQFKDQVHLITFFAERDGTFQQYGTTPRPLGEILRQDIPQIKNVCRIDDRDVIVKHGPDVFHERVRYVDPAFLEMFTFPLKWGSASSLKDLNSIILSEDMSKKYFGDANPIGMIMLLKFDNERSKEFKVAGVAAEFPKARTISFNFLIHIDNLLTSHPDADFSDWKSFLAATFIQVENPADTLLVERALTNYKKIQNDAVTDEWAIASFGFQPLATLHEKSEHIRDDISRSSTSNYQTIVYLLFIASVLLVLACFNYINIAIVTAARRLKEIGVRKSIGANRKTVIIQFLSENLVITLFAMICGAALGAMFFIPAFEKLWSFSMDFQLGDPFLWIFLPAVMVITAFVSGIYPSLYISRFQAAGILRGSVKFGHRNPITKVFLCIQLILSCMFITGAGMFTQNNSYLAKRPWGYDQRETMYAVMPDNASFEQLSALMAREADVLSIAGSKHHVGREHAPVVAHFESRDYEVDMLSVDARYFETLGLPLKQGRVFIDHEGSDRNNIIVNELLVENMKWNDAIGKQLRIDSVDYHVIGVVRDFHSYSFGTPMRPVVFRLGGRSEMKYLTLKVKEGTEIATYKKLQDKWAELLPETPFAGGLQEDVWGFYFSTIRIYATVWKTIAFIAVALAALGLYGLISLNVEARFREFSIRKVMGAGTSSILKNIMNQYTIMFIVALAIGAPLGQYLMEMILVSSSTYHVPITFTAVVISCVMLVAILLVTVATQVKKVLGMNAVDGLKVE